jgi:hypothetical protein
MLTKPDRTTVLGDPRLARNPGKRRRRTSLNRCYRWDCSAGTVALLNNFLLSAGSRRTCGALGRDGRDHHPPPRPCTNDARRSRTSANGRSSDLTRRVRCRPETVVARARRGYEFRRGAAGTTSGNPLTGTSRKAGDETRTRDPELGKLVLYQLSYTRIRLKLSDARPSTFVYIESGADTPTRSRAVFTSVAVASQSAIRNACTSSGGRGSLMIGQSW